LVNLFDKIILTIESTSFRISVLDNYFAFVSMLLHFFVRLNKWSSVILGLVHSRYGVDFEFEFASVEIWKHFFRKILN
jgi:hypothetical protein